MVREELQRWILIGILAWCALALSVCHSARVDIQPAPVKVLPVAAQPPAGAAGPQHTVVIESERQAPPVWAAIMDEVVRAGLPLAIMVAAAWALATFLPPLWDAVATLFGKNRPNPLAEGSLTFAGAIAAGYAAIKPDLKEHSFIVILIGAFGALGCLLLARIKRLEYRILALTGVATALLGLPTLAIAVWPFFVRKGKDDISVTINGWQAMIEELHKVTPDTLAVLALALAIFVIKVGLALARPNPT